jgi:hypothetical protein
MGTDEKQEGKKGLSLPGTSTADLRGRQSVRATFRLTEGCIDAISIVAAHLGIKQKSLFDHLVEDTGSLRSIAREIQRVKLSKHGRIQKTFVISRRSLSSLDIVSKNFDTPRDALVEFSVQRLLPIIAKERARHDKRKEMLVEIESHYRKGQNLLKKIGNLLGPDDPIYHKLGSVMAVYENAYDNIESFIERGRIIEEFEEDFLER